MAKRRDRRQKMSALLEPDAAGIDIGAEEIFVAVAPDRDAEPVRRFGTFRCDLNALADWLERCHVRTVAMESTAVYWIPLFQLLEERSIKVYLVNAHYLKSVPGRKSDASDCQWIQYLHSVGLLVLPESDRRVGPGDSPADARSPQRYRRTGDTYTD